MRFKIDWASLIVGSKFAVFAFFYFVFEGNFLSTAPLGAYIWRGDLTEGFISVTGLGGLYMERLIFSSSVKIDDSSHFVPVIATHYVWATCGRD